MLNAKHHKIDSFVIDVFLMRLWDLWRSDYGDGFEQLLSAAKLPAAAAAAVIVVVVVAVVVVVVVVAAAAAVAAAACCTFVTIHKHMQPFCTITFDERSSKQVFPLVYDCLLSNHRRIFHFKYM